MPAPWHQFPANQGKLPGDAIVKEWIGCSVWIALGLVGLIASLDLQVVTRFGPGPGFFIRGLTIAMLVLGLIQASALVLSAHSKRRLSQPSPDNVVAVLNLDEDEDPMVVTPGSLVRFGLLAATLFAYGLLIEPAGFIVSTSLLAFSAMTLLGRPAMRSAVEAVAAAVIAYLAFGILLGVNLPTSSMPLLSSIGL
ncbi:tripartite tricarboxylate transporter TctB family protein [Aureimonas fodinaquatilis]|uniref:Tripartite tricarboxylate transporter TctB family protein n=1 Tax=Aureimonas fodinaquatilis TaxID=2565783 RepID=A0A5B0DSB9_9HYPH|nr:tripartite tricarboxylate transporter TctB family protein [Aureimonas fodinaquatilis]KAA0969338.1 tripartite tricarboxylate transporter TctB family protein [Aureimonas fodinaquatilis]